MKPFANRAVQLAVHLTAGVAVIGLLGFSVAVQADPGRGVGVGRGGGGDFRGGSMGALRGGGPTPWHGNDVQRFHERDYSVWRSGGWYHGYYGGRLAWWWVVGGLYYFYPAPIYPYPDPYIPGPYMTAPPATVIQPQSTSPVWYYCEPAGAYYPYVAECPSGWKTVPATPSK